jgi:hypothetical protein
MYISITEDTSSELNISIFWDIPPFNPYVDVSAERITSVIKKSTCNRYLSRHLLYVSFLHGWFPSLKMEVIFAPETPVHIRTMRRYTQENGDIHNYRCENHKFYISCEIFNQYYLDLILGTKFQRLRQVRYRSCSKIESQNTCTFWDITHHIPEDRPVRYSLKHDHKPRENFAAFSGSRTIVHSKTTPTTGIQQFSTVEV